jgi:hypothetical protein
LCQENVPFACSGVADRILYISLDRVPLTEISIAINHRLALGTEDLQPARYTRAQPTVQSAQPPVQSAGFVNQGGDGGGTMEKDITQTMVRSLHGFQAANGTQPHGNLLRLSA